MGQPEIKTERLLLRGFSHKDAKQVQAMAGNYNVAKSTLNIPHPYEDGLAEKWIDSHADGWNNKTRVTYAITHKITNKLLGAISLMDIEDSHAKLGYWVGETYWGRGYCTEAAVAIIKYSFSELGITRIVAQHLSTNLASAKVMKKSGMYHTGSSSITGRNRKIVNVEIYEIQKA